MEAASFEIVYRSIAAFPTCPSGMEHLNSASRSTVEEIPAIALEVKTLFSLPDEQNARELLNDE